MEKKEIIAKIVFIVVFILGMFCLYKMVTGCGEALDEYMNKPKLIKHEN